MIVTLGRVMTLTMMGSIFTRIATWKGRGLDHLAEMARCL